MDKVTFDPDGLQKLDVEHREHIQHDASFGKPNIARDDVMHFAQLSEEELIVQKKLVRKIDILIMPLVILVYLMNYIDRYGTRLY